MCEIAPPVRLVPKPFTSQSDVRDGPLCKTFLVAGCAKPSKPLSPGGFQQELQQYEYQTYCPTRYCLTIGQQLPFTLKKQLARNWLESACKANIGGPEWMKISSIYYYVIALIERFHPGMACHSLSANLLH